MRTMQIRDIKESDFKVTRGKRKTYLLPKKEIAISSKCPFDADKQRSTIYHNFESAKEARRFASRLKRQGCKIKIYKRRRKN